MLAIVTGTIKPAADMKQLVIRDGQERLEQYEKSIYHLIDSDAFSKIIFCENSNYGAEKLQSLVAYAQAKGTLLEVLSFQGNDKEAQVHGKGYGEGEIMKYAFDHSELVKGETFFVKITGRLLVKNIMDITKRLDAGATYFNIPNRTRRDIYDTRIYAMPISRFKDDFQEAFVKVHDDKEIFLEHVYTEVLIRNKIPVKNFPRYPRIVGISGSGGIRYEYTEWKSKIRDIFSRMGCYKVKQ